MSAIQNLDLNHYGQEALATWRTRGATAVEFFCVGSTQNCTYSRAVIIEEAIKKWGASKTLLLLARRARCKSCGKLGCHVQVSFRLGHGGTADDPPKYVDVRDARKALRR